MRAYPHELSGGLRQRVMIAIAIAGDPALIIADEPTTALDVTVQAQVLRLLQRLRDEIGCSIVLITHDLGVAAQIADRIAVLYAGRIAEIGPTAEVLGTPAHPYTHGLLRSRLTLDTARDRKLAALAGSVPSPVSPLPGCAFAPRCALATDDVRDDAARPDRGRARSRQRLHPAARRRVAQDSAPRRRPPPNRSLTSSRRRRAAAVGRAARRRQDVLGRQTLAGPVEGQPRQTAGAARGFADRRRTASRSRWSARAARASRRCCGSIAGLEKPTSGDVELAGGNRPQMVFQDAGASLTPWLTVGELIAERLRGHRHVTQPNGATRSPRCSRASACRADVAKSRAGQLSGGQRQRVSLARATVVPPSVLLCDEPTSALDVSLAASVLNLIGDLRRSLDMSVVFVTHDLSVARVVADRIAVMYLGRIVEIGPADAGDRRSRAPLHAGARRLDPRPRPRIPGAARRTGQPAVAADRLRVPPALPASPIDACGGERARRPARGLAPGNPHQVACIERRAD